MAIAMPDDSSKHANKRSSLGILHMPDDRDQTASQSLGQDDSMDMRKEGKDARDQKKGWGTIKEKLAGSVAWIPANCTFARLKPVIRCSLSAWISLVLFLIPRVEAVLGQASFLIMIAAFISPPSEPFAAVLEKEIVTVFGISLAWGWSCLGIKLASLTRTTLVPEATIPAIFSGQYLEAAPCLIFAVFLFLGTAFILFIKAWLGPGPLAPATVFACLCVDISLTVAPLYPYPFYMIGRTVVVPIAVHAGLSLVTSVLVFPESVNAQFVKRLRAVLEPLAVGIKQQNKLLNTPPLSDDFDPNTFAAEITKSEAAFTPLSASARLVKRDVSWGRFNGKDLRSLQMYGRKLMMSTAGMMYFYRTMDTQRQKFPGTPLPSQPATPIDTPVQTRTATPTHSDDEDDSTNLHGDRSSIAGSGSPSHRKLHKPHRPHQSHLHSWHFHLPRHHHLLREALNQSQEHYPVGVFESQKYMNIEKRRRHPHGEMLEERSVRLLAESAQDLLDEVGAALDHVLGWLERLNTDRYRFYRSKNFHDSIAANEKALEKFNEALECFLHEKRHIILEPYRGTLNPLKDPRNDLPPPRFLFRIFIYQYHLLRFGENLRDMMQETVQLDKDRRRNRLWPPLLPIRRVFTWSAWEANEATGRADDESPDVIPGVTVKSENIGGAEPRDADALPPSNVIELVGTRIHAFVSALGGGNGQFALKAGILSLLLALPSYLKTSGAFSYIHKSIWALFIAQLTLARYRGDTIFGFSSRLFSTFAGGLVGLVVWYISSGSGAGNPYALAAVGAVVFPVLTFARIYAPGPPMTTIIFCTTIVLIVGNSWQDTHSPTLSSPGHGWDVAWRRFLLVAIGVTAASLVSFLPPSTTIRRYQRTALSTTTSEIGSLYCAIVSYAHNRREEDKEEIFRNLVALRAKLKRLGAQTANVQYEFSLRGKWPAERYNKVLNVQLEIAYLLSHLMSVVLHLEPTWSRAFLQRTRFLDSEFLGDVLGVISMICTSLRTGVPLPQITPTPLLDRFWRNDYGLDILQQEAAEDYGLPRTVTFDTLQDAQCFSVGIVSASGIIARLDRLVLATKELVGERFHIDGVGLNVLPLTGAAEHSPQAKTTRFAPQDGAYDGERIPEKTV